MEFQAFGFVYRHDTDAVNLTARNGLLTKLLIPILQEGSQLGGMIVEIFTHGIIELEHIGILILYPME